jgi:hypothetical protein
MLLIEANKLPNLIKLGIAERWLHLRSRPNAWCVTHFRVDFTAVRKTRGDTCLTLLAQAIPSSESV